MGAYFTISSIVYIGIFIFFFFSKNKVKTPETKVYKVLLITTFIGLCLDALSFFVYESGVNPNSFLYQSLSKGVLIYFLVWVASFTYYIYVISHDYIKNKDEYYVKLTKFKKLLTIIFGVLIAFVFTVPISFEVKNDVIFPQGIGVGTTYLTVGICVIVCFFFAFKNMKHIVLKKYTPLFAMVVLVILSAVVQIIFPELFLVNFAIGLIVVLLYFSIENPDIKMLNVLYKNKELMEQNYEDKYNFLFEITQEARHPLLNITKLCSEIKNEEDVRKIKTGTLAIENIAKQLDFSINNIMNISTLDVQKLHIVDSKYSLSKLCSNVIMRCKNEMNADIDFKYSFPNEDIELYGDYMKIRQILSSLVLNSSKKVNQGYVEFKVNMIEKYDVCRLIFTITDSGQGISIERINEILSITSELSKQELEELEMNEFNIELCQKVIKMMGGHLMIKSNSGKENEIKLTIDQRVYRPENNSLLNQYENDINHYKRVLLISQNKQIISRIRNVCREKDIRFSSLLYGKDAIDRIKSGRKYDFILIFDNMKEMSGLMTLKGMRELKNFKTPTIVILDETSEQIKDHYLEDGFDDYLLLNDFESEIKRIMDKY